MIRHALLKHISIIAATVATGVFISGSAFAQTPSDDPTPSDDIEGLFNKDQDVQLAPPKAEQPTPPPAPGVLPGSTKSTMPDIKNVSDLGKLSELSDIAVIQKRYLPKTGRFEAYIAPSLVLNDAFFINVGGNARINYSFAERFAAELTGFFLVTTERSLTAELRDKRGVITTSLITPKSYYGLDFKYTPVYGKMAFLNDRIVPFDLYFSLGAGMTSTNLGSNEPTLHLGTGQIFARTKSSSYRWDFSWNMFSAQPTPQDSRSFYNTLFISIGMSFFFPEATYR